MYPIDNDDDNRHSQTRKHSSRMHTDRSSDSGGGLCSEAPWTEILQKEHGTRDRDPPRRNMGLGNQAESDIIQRPPPPHCGEANTCEDITLAQTSFVGGNHDCLCSL